MACPQCKTNDQIVCPCFWLGVEHGDTRAAFHLCGDMSYPKITGIEWWAVFGHNLALAGFGQMMWNKAIHYQFCKGDVPMLKSDAHWQPNINGRGI